MSAFGLTDFSTISFKFLNAKESADFLSTPDDFLNHLTPIDLSLHHSTPKTITVDEHRDFLKNVTLNWTADEIKLINNEIDLMKTAINSLDLNLNLPKEILLIKTTGADEFNAHYTRGNAIIFPIKSFDLGVTTDAPTIFHETFHIMSRHNPNLTNDLYSICHFKSIQRLETPLSLQDVSLTNPDAFYYEHSVVVIEIKTGKEIEVVPFFYSGLKQSEIKGPVDEATTFKLGLLDLTTIQDTHPTLYKTSETDYKIKTMANSTYYIHPEEIMAENFRLLLTRAAQITPIPIIKFPKVLDELKDLLRK